MISIPLGPVVPLEPRLVGRVDVESLELFRKLVARRSPHDRARLGAAPGRLSETPSGLFARRLRRRRD